MASRVHPAYSAPFDPHESGYDIVTRPSGTRKWWARFVCGSSSKPAQSGARLRIRRASLGVGGHSSVVTGSYGPKSVPVAVKVLSNADPHTMNELAAFRRLGISHRNVVEAHPAIISPHFKTVYLPLELCDTSLLALCHTRGGLEEIEAAAIFAGVVDGLTFLHSNGVYHQDVKPDNILLKNGTAKLADLGAAVLSFGNQDAAAGGPDASMLTGHKPVGTSRYASPESIAARMCETMSTSIKQRQSAGEAVSSRENTRLRRLSTTVSETAFDPAKADVWSTGITLFSTVTGVFPWGLASPDNAVFSRWQAMYVFPASPSEDSLRAMWSAVFLTYGSCTQKKTPLSYNFMHLLRGMLHPDPVQRMSMTEVRAHPFFHRSNDCTTSKPPLMSSIPSSQTHASSASLTSTATRSGIALATATH